MAKIIWNRCIRTSRPMDIQAYRWILLLHWIKTRVSGNQLRRAKTLKGLADGEVKVIWTAHAEGHE